MSTCRTHSPTTQYYTLKVNRQWYTKVISLLHTQAHHTGKSNKGYLSLATLLGRILVYGHLILDIQRKRLAEGRLELWVLKGDGH